MVDVAIQAQRRTKDDPKTRCLSSWPPTNSSHLHVSHVEQNVSSLRLTGPSVVPVMSLLGTPEVERGWGDYRDQPLLRCDFGERLDSSLLPVVGLPPQLSDHPDPLPLEDMGFLAWLRTCSLPSVRTPLHWFRSGFQWDRISTCCGDRFFDQYALWRSDYSAACCVWPWYIRLGVLLPMRVPRGAPIFCSSFRTSSILSRFLYRLFTPERSLCRSFCSQNGLYGLRLGRGLPAQAC